MPFWKEIQDKFTLNKIQNEPFFSDYWNNAADRRTCYFWCLNQRYCIFNLKSSRKISIIDVKMFKDDLFFTNATYVCSWSNRFFIFSCQANITIRGNFIFFLLTAFFNFVFRWVLNRKKKITPFNFFTKAILLLPTKSWIEICHDTSMLRRKNIQIFVFMHMILILNHKLKMIWSFLDWYFKFIFFANFSKLFLSPMISSISLFLLKSSHFSDLKAGKKSKPNSYSEFAQRISFLKQGKSESLASILDMLLREALISLKRFFHLLSIDRSLFPILFPLKSMVWRGFPTLMVASPYSVMPVPASLRVCSLSSFSSFLKPESSPMWFSPRIKWKVPKSSSSSPAGTDPNISGTASFVSWFLNKLSFFRFGKYRRLSIPSFDSSLKPASEYIFTQVQLDDRCKFSFLKLSE